MPASLLLTLLILIIFIGIPASLCWPDEPTDSQF